MSAVRNKTQVFLVNPVCFVQRQSVDFKIQQILALVKISKKMKLQQCLKWNSDWTQQVGYGIINDTKHLGVRRSLFLRVLYR